MSEETLFTAARRAVRFFDIDMAKGGLIKPETEHAFGLLRVQLDMEANRQKAAAGRGKDPEPPEPAPAPSDGPLPSSAPANALRESTSA